MANQQHLELLKQFAQTLGHRGQTHRVDHLPLWSSQVGAKNDCGSMIEQVADRGQCRSNAGIIGNMPYSHQLKEKDDNKRLIWHE